MQLEFQATLNYEGIAYEIVIFDVGKAIAYESNKEEYILASTQNPKKHKKTPFAMSWNQYHKYDDILKYLELIRRRNPHIVELIHIGRSYEGRPLVVVKLELKKENNEETSSAAVDQKYKFRRKPSQPRKAIFIEAGTHGMEWIGPATATWIINEVLGVMKNNSEYLKYNNLNLNLNSIFKLTSQYLE